MNARPVMVVEDDSDSRVMIATLLTLHGYQVVTAVNGAEGLEVARQYQPCLILLDLMMPVMDGPTFRAEQLKDPSLAPIPVMCVSGRHNARELAKELGVLGVIGKPIAMQPLIETVRRHCDGRGA